MCKRKPTEVWRQKGHPELDESKQGNTEQQPTSEEKIVTSGGTVDVMKDIDAKGLDAGQGLSKSQTQVGNLEHTVIASDDSIL